MLPARSGTGVRRSRQRQASNQYELRRPGEGTGSAVVPVLLNPRLMILVSRPDLAVVHQPLTGWK